MNIETREMSVELLKHLSPGQQLAIAWQCVGFSEQEIADIVGVSKRAVHSLLAGGKALMRRKLVEQNVATAAAAGECI